MSHLSSINHIKLTATVIKLLKNNNIHNVVDFMKEDTERLCLISKLPFKDVLEIRTFIQLNYIKYVNAIDYYKHISTTFAILPTCILSLDNLLLGGLRCCKITELCGLPDSGKTLLALTISCNISYILKQYILYIDTKNDFDAVAFRNIMKYRCKDESEINENLKRIKVVKIWNMLDCLSFLHDLYSNKEFMNQIKLIIIDSLPALVLQYKRENSNTEYFGYLNNCVNIIRRLSVEYNIPFIVINLLTRWVDNQMNNDKQNDPDTNYKINVKPTLGKYWRHIPYISLDVTKISDNQLSIGIRSSSTFKSNEHVVMKISEEGLT